MCARIAASVRGASRRLGNHLDREHFKPAAGRLCYPGALIPIFTFLLCFAEMSYTPTRLSDCFCNKPGVARGLRDYLGAVAENDDAG